MCFVWVYLRGAVFPVSRSLAWPCSACPANAASRGRPYAGPGLSDIWRIYRRNSSPCRGQRRPPPKPSDIASPRAHSSSPFQVIASSELIARHTALSPRSHPFSHLPLKIPLHAISFFKATHIQRRYEHQDRLNRFLLEYAFE